MSAANVPRSLKCSARSPSTRRALAGDRAAQARPRRRLSQAHDAAGLSWARLALRPAHRQCCAIRPLSLRPRTRTIFCLPRVEQRPVFGCRPDEIVLVRDLWQGWTPSLPPRQHSVTMRRHGQDSGRWKSAAQPPGISARRTSRSCICSRPRPCATILRRPRQFRSPSELFVAGHSLHSPYAVISMPR